MVGAPRTWSPTRRVPRLVDDPQPHGLALLWPELGERSLHDRAQLTERGEVLDPRLLVEVELRRLNAEPPQGAALGLTAPQRLVQDVARDPEDQVQLEGARVGLGDEVDGELRVVRAPREVDKQPPPIARS